MPTNNKTSSPPADQAAELRRRCGGLKPLSDAGQRYIEEIYQAQAKAVAAGAVVPGLPPGFVCNDWDGLA